MRVALVLCPTWAAEKPPLGIPYLAAHLRRHGHDVVPFDFNIELYNAIDPRHRDIWNVGAYKIWMDYHFFSILFPEVFPFAMQETKELHAIASRVVWRWADRVLAERPRLVGFTAMANTTLFSLLLAREIKERDPSIVVVFGGPNCMRGTNERFFLATGWVDCVLPGEGEAKLLDFVGTLEDKGRVEPTPGALVRRGGEILDGGPAPLIANLDDLPFPDFGDFDSSQYVYRYEELPITLSRGCMGRCSFCVDWIFWEKVRFRSPENIVAEMKHQSKKHGCIRFYLNDLVFNGNPRQLEAMCDLIVSEGLQVHWSGNGRARPKLGPELLGKMHRSGCRMIHYGLEHGSQKILDLFGKSLGVEDYSEALRDGHEAGIRFSVSLILGAPTETWIDYLKCLLFVLRHRKGLQEVHVGSLLLMRGSKLWEERERYGIVLPERPSFPEELAYCEGYTYPFVHNWATRDGKSTRENRERKMNLFRALLHFLEIDENQAGARLEEHYEPGAA